MPRFRPFEEWEAGGGGWSGGGSGRRWRARLSRFIWQTLNDVQNWIRKPDSLSLFKRITITITRNISISIGIIIIIIKKFHETKNSNRTQKKNIPKKNLLQTLKLRNLIYTLKPNTRFYHCHENSNYNKTFLYNHNYRYYKNHNKNYN